MEGTSIQVSHTSIYAQGRNKRLSGWHCWCAASAVKIQVYATIVPSEQHFSLMLHLLLLLLLLQQPLLLLLLKEVIVIWWTLLCEVKRTFPIGAQFQRGLSKREWILNGWTKFLNWIVREAGLGKLQIFEVMVVDWKLETDIRKKQLLNYSIDFWICIFCGKCI